jgi:hypothetical protein
MVNLQEYFKHKLSQVGYDLFAVFARFEYAMKKGGYRRQNSADAAWRAFAADLPPDFFERMKAAPEAAIYFTSPPDHLVPDTASGVRWSGKPDVPGDAAGLFDSIKTARNNLFHGDKSHNSQRDTDLMAAALFVLNAAFEAAERDRRFDAFISEMEYGL